MYEYKANYNDLISDFNLYLCERYGYRNACIFPKLTNKFCKGRTNGLYTF